HVAGSLRSHVARVAAVTLRALEPLQQERSAPATSLTLTRKIRLRLQEYRVDKEHSADLVTITPKQPSDYETICTSFLP
ncbi:hypothetical protein, partial [Neolewinella persica]|uniref:hypothetical protein n=1 Tax=Neolewinella persica TaxID=70998 RepID=UPI001B7F859F